MIAARGVGGEVRKNRNGYPQGTEKHQVSGLLSELMEYGMDLSTPLPPDAPSANAVGSTGNAMWWISCLENTKPMSQKNSKTRESRVQRRSGQPRPGVLLIPNFWQSWQFNRILFDD